MFVSQKKKVLSPYLNISTAFFQCSKPYGTPLWNTLHADMSNASLKRRVSHLLIWFIFSSIVFSDIVSTNDSQVFSSSNVKYGTLCPEKTDRYWRCNICKHTIFQVAQSGIKIAGLLSYSTPSIGCFACLVIHYH